MDETLRQLEPTEQFARQLDEGDELQSFRREFYLPDGTIYLDGNSLGLLSCSAEQSLLTVLQQWKERAIGGWLDATPPWFDLAERLGARLAELLGAHSDEVVVANSVSVNLYQLLATLYRPEARAEKILIDELAFPTDRYAVVSHLRQVGKEPAACLVEVPSQDGLTLKEADIIERFADGVQIALLPSVVYTSGQLLDIDRLTTAAHRHKVTIGFDCAHSVGVVPHALSDEGVDFAVGCTYKYLGAGPGAIGFLYLNRRQFDKAPGLAGWFGSRKDRQFEMSAEFEPARGAGGLQIGTPPILSAAPLIGALDLIQRAGIQQMRQKSLRLTTYLMRCGETMLRPYGTQVVELPASSRGGHVALLHPAARAISWALRDAGVIPDYRPPDLIRLCPAPLYTSFVDCYRAMISLQDILRSGSYRDFQRDGREVP